MKEERSHILKMVADGKITVEEANGLIEALGSPSESEKTSHPVSGRLLRIRVMQADKPKVNVSIPLELARFAMRFVPKDSEFGDLDLDEIVRVAKEGSRGKLAEVNTETERIEIFVD